MSKLKLKHERRSLKFETMPTSPTTRSEIRECVCYDLKVNNILNEPNILTIRSHEVSYSNILELASKAGRVLWWCDIRQ